MSAAQTTCLCNDTYCNEPGFHIVNTSTTLSSTSIPTNTPIPSAKTTTGSGVRHEIENALMLSVIVIAYIICRLWYKSVHVNIQNCKMKTLLFSWLLFHALEKAFSTLCSFCESCLYVFFQINGTFLNKFFLRHLLQGSFIAAPFVHQIYSISFKLRDLPVFNYWRFPPCLHVY